MTSFDPVNRLEALLVSAATDFSYRAEFLRELLQSYVLVLSDDPRPEGRTQIQAGETISLRQWSGPSGPFIPLFSSHERLQEASTSAGVPMRFLTVKGADVFGLLAQSEDEAVLNPGLAYGKRFTASEIRDLVDGSIFHRAPQLEGPPGPRLRQPAVVPTQLVDALTRAFHQRPSVQAAYLCEVCFAGDVEPPHPLVGIVSSNVAEDVKAVGPIADALGIGPVDFLHMRDGDQGASAYLRTQTKPFYERTVAPRPWWNWWSS